MELHHGLVLVPLLVASFGYSCFLIPLLPKGITRLIFLLPVFYILSIVPWIFASSIALRSLSAFLVTWITSFKLILLCFDQGPLVNATTRFIDFALIAILPIKLREATEHGQRNCEYNSNGLVTIGVWSLSILWSLLTLSTTTRFHFLVTIAILALLFSSRRSATRLARATVDRYEMVQLSDHPENSSSLQDFWGRRWNRFASDILRQTIYDPVRNVMSCSTLIGVSPVAARVVALVATLLVSGLMHELMFYYITCGGRPTWEVSLFFVLHGVCMAIEYGLSGSTFLHPATRWQPVRPSIATWSTLGFVTATGYWLVLLPTLRKGELGECRTVPKVW